MSKLGYFVASLALFMAGHNAVADDYKEGQDYWVMQHIDAIAVATDDNLYFTWLGCDSCRKIERELTEELADFEVVPLIARQDWRPAAKAFYALQILGGSAEDWGKLKQQVEEKSLDPTDQKALFAAIIELGFDKDDVRELLEDRALYQRINQAEALANHYDIEYVPTVVVKGRYATDARSTMTVKKFAQVIGYLKSL